MPESLSFAVVHSYDTRAPGITVRAEMHREDRIVEVIAKIDTGASFCIFQRSYGELLGLNIESGDEERINTATGTFLAYGHEVLLKVLGIELTTTVYFADYPQTNRNVLGRQGWLDRVRLGLVDYEGKLYLSSYDDSD